MQGGVLFRSYPDDFQLCMPRTIGFPKILVQKDEMPTLEELNEAFKGEKVLQRVAACCSVLQHVAVCCRKMKCPLLRNSTKRSRAKRCSSVLQCVAACCRVLLCVAER